MNVTPRYARLKASPVSGSKAEVIGWENIELISDRPFETMLAEMRQLKQEYPDRILIASIMEEYNRGAWEEIIERVEEAGVVSLKPHHTLHLPLRSITDHMKFTSYRLGLKMPCPYRPQQII